MSKDQAIGGALLVISIIVILAYGYLVFFSQWSLFILQLTGFIAVAGVFAILAWIGYTLATTPPPKPIEEIEKEIEAEMQKIEKEGGEEKQGEGTQQKQ
jgi:predicted DNA-binding transcriptional regulator